MKRNSIIKPRDKWKHPHNSSMRGVSGIRSSDLHSRARIALERRDMDRNDKRKFWGPESDYLPNIQNACSVQDEPIQDPGSDAPKTSEYAYFKKLKKDVARSDLHPPQRENDYSVNGESENCTRERTMKLKEIYNGLKLSIPIGKERSGDRTCFLSPVREESSEMINMVETNDNSRGFPLLNQKVTPINHDIWPSTFQDIPNDTGMHSDKGIFSSKRQKLRQWVANTSHQNGDELPSKGFSLVSMLLNRLFPEDNKENRYSEPNRSQSVSDARSQLHVFSNNNTHSGGHYWTETNNLMQSEDGVYQDDCFTQCLSEHRRDVILPELDNVGGDSPSSSKENRYWEPKYGQADIDACLRLPFYSDNITHLKGSYSTHTNNLMKSDDGAYQDDCFRQCLSGRQRDAILPELDNVGADSPSTSYPVYFPCKYWRPNCNINGMITERLLSEKNSCFQLRPEKYESIAWVNCLKEFDGSYDPNGSLLHRQPATHLLGWDYNNDNDKQNLSISSNDTKMSSLENSGSNDHWWSRQSESALCSSSLVSGYLNWSSFAHSSSPNFLCTDESGGDIQDEDYLYLKLDHLPVGFSCNGGSLKFLHGVVEDCSKNNILEPSNTVSSPHDQYWNLSKVINENHDHDLKSLFFPEGLNLELGKNQLSVYDFATKDRLSVLHAFQNPSHVGSAAYLNGEEEKACSLYNPSCIPDYCDSLNFQDCSALTYQISCDKQGVHYSQKHITGWGSSIHEMYHTEADDDNGCEDI